MSLKDVLKEIGDIALSGISAYGNQITAYENQYDRYSDEELVDEYRVMANRIRRASYGSSTKAECNARAAAIENVLRSRGYDV